MTSGGELLVQCLEEQDVDRVFCVPGESYLAVLDALFDSPIETVVARQEGGAAIMAEADGKLTGRPGICFVTRGPGATNASSGVHIAQQDSTPMILFVGQIGRDMRGRDAFQEVDYRQFYGGMAKWVEEIDRVDRIPEIVSHAYHIAMSGRPGPIVLALPEDMLREESDAEPGKRVTVADPAPAQRDVGAFIGMLEAAERPMLIAGGSRWTADCVTKLQALSERWDLPVGCSFRRQMLFDNAHKNYAGDVGLGINPALSKRAGEADLLILLGARLSENPSQNFSLIGIPTPEQTLIHVHPGPEELGRIYRPDLPVNATPGAFLDAVLANNKTANGSGERAAGSHEDYLGWSDIIPNSPGRLQMGAVIGHLRDYLSETAIMTNGAGNYAVWLHRFYRYRAFGTQVAPISGSMGYGLPAAIAAKLRHPEQPVVCFAGDGCFQMTCQELGTANQAGANIVVLVIDNGSYGTIRMHQEQRYPGRVSATDLVNPDFAALARSYGCFAETVEANDDFPAAFERAMDAGMPALLHLKVDPEAITPTKTISDFRTAASHSK